jgi:hypothetical protein
MRTIPSREEFLKGCNAYEEHEKRDSMYKVSTFLVSHFWGKFNEMADGLGVLLLTWNQAFYRYGIFNFDNLENCIHNNFYKLETFRKRIITDLQVLDQNDIKSLFNNFLEALRVERDGKQKKSPVAVAKALHILAPNFFPLWDKKIAEAHGLRFKNPDDEYFAFCKISAYLAQEIKDYVEHPVKPLLRLIDEYNYAKFTKNWI